ncbi:hypothetical protein P3X46_008721 [Hevea brasiliensis]|uniref:RING-type E3 ubiquitin transferase n=1 Tax=Hevea brasiliensis TaxID=3981 RepID=A0ABQ9MNM6_HEVBR|nr:U-box domain-containing protein 43 isoform X1 [Hevea brasiliensis]XP_058002966.1 U-box domain-containing protein 43 isoform X1 [Hevea brasiliensis]XP_058002967.1 U-box domain-containing protein 43 isoform X1 [Hevea brasiliensis]KAJ9180489.1 hypothetical protein P3X46_008721 [Hevea brasiliensis]
MDFDIGIEDVGLMVLQELWNRVASQAVDLVSETRDVVLEKDTFQQFSSSISELSTLLLALDAKKVEAAMGSEFTKSALETLNGQLKKARKIVKDYKSGSRLRLLLHSHSILLQMQELAKEIAKTISSFQLVNLDMALNLKTMTELVINNLTSMELRSATATETIAFEIENSISQNNRNRENSVKLLEKIADAVGASANASLVQNELARLRQEKEEMEDQKNQAEALQLSQLIQLLYSTEIVTRPQNEDCPTYQQKHPITSFVCPLCNEIMADPVAIFCGHSFERKAIQDYFNRGEKNCPTCREELPSLELTPNVNLRSSIEEWKRREMDLTFQAALSAINSNDHSKQNKALEDLQFLTEMPDNAIKVAEQGLIPKLVEFLKDSRLNTMATLKCLYFLAKNCDNHKEAIVEAGVVRRIVKQIYTGERIPDAIAVLLELSNNETLREKIGSTNDCIPLLVSLLDNSNSDISQKAKKMLDNFSSNTSFVVKMAEAGYFQPFVARFNQGPQESRGWMADDLLKMQLKENRMKDLEDGQFIQSLIQMLSSNSSAYKLVCLKCIKKLTAYPRMAKRLLSDSATIPPLLGLISFISPDPNLKQEAGEILALLVGACQYPQFQMHQSLQELQSKHNISLFLQLVICSDPQIKFQFLHLLVELSHKSDIARSLIRSNGDAVAHLFSSLDGDEPLVKRWVLKLIHCISDGHPDGVPLPSSPGKETAINTLVAILTHSLDIEERRLAAGIISQLPKDDITIDDILHKSEALKAIREVICSMEEEDNGIRAPTNVDTSLLENALAALLRFTEPTKPEFRRQVGKLELYPSLVRVLSSGSSLAKKRTAIALAQLSQSTSVSVSDATIVANQANNSLPLLRLMNLFPNMPWCCSTSSEIENLCAVHGAACLHRHTFCLIKANAVKPLVRTLSDTETGVAEAALMALETLLTDNSSPSHATAAIVDSEGVVAILQLLEKGTLPAKTKALDLFHEIVKHKPLQISDQLFQRSERILVQLLQEDALKKKVGLVLRQMNIMPDQSSYF